MKHLINYTSIIAILCIATSSFGQCVADFDFDDSSLVVTFEDQSLHTQGDSIISYNWEFGDISNISSLPSPVHIYGQSGSYDVTLIITTELGCMDTVTQSIYICDFNLQYDLQVGCDDDNKVSLDLFIRDIHGSAEEFNVFLDDKLLNSNPLTTINDTISLYTELLADGELHTVNIQSINHPNCQLIEEFNVSPCVAPCSLSNLTADLTSNRVVYASVNESGYTPQVLNVSTGDTILFTWTTDNRSVKSQANNNGQNWNSGILNTGDEFKLYSFAPGIYTYKSSHDPIANMTGSLVSTCPDTAYYDLLLTFQSEGQLGAYDLWVDGVPSDLRNIPYAQNGLDSILLILPGDGILHNYQVIDAASPSCRINTTVQAPICGVPSDCNLFLTASQITPCDQDSIVEVAFTILSSGRSENGFDLYIDEELFESNIPYTGTETIITRSLFGDGEVHNIRVADTAQDTCESSTTILLEDCTQPCMIINAFAGVGSNKSIVANVLNDSFAPKDITISVGDRLIWQWQTDTLRSVTAFDFLFDSGVKGPGSAYTSPILPIGVHRYYSEYNGMEGSITVQPNCEGGLIPIVYNFNKFGGANTGYNVLVDSVKINGDPIPYGANGNSSGNSFVSGNGGTHMVQIIDAVDSTCRATRVFTAPFCDASTCAVFLENLTFSECYDNNTVDLTVDLLSYNNIDTLFTVAINGIITDTLVYDTSGITSIVLNVAGDGNMQEISITDLGEDICSTSLSFTAPLCDNPCTFDAIDIEYVLEEVGDSCYDGNVQIIVTTQSIHNFNSDYSITLSSENVDISETHNYPSNGYISHVFTLPANGELLEVTFSNVLSEECQKDTIFNIFECSPDPCSVNVAGLSYDNCRDGGLMDMSIEIDTFRISDSLSVLLDDVEIFYGSYEDFYEISGFEITYTGEERKLNLVDIGHPSCNSEELFFTDFCPIDCIIEASYMLSDSCILAEDSTYNIIITGSVLNAISDSILLDLVSSNILHQYSYADLVNGITLPISRADDNPTLGIFDLADDSCRKFLPIDPPSCILDCNISIDNAIVLEDECINGIRLVAFEISYGYEDSDSLEIVVDGTLVNSLQYPMDSLITIPMVGDGMSHKVIIRDLSNEICADTLDFVVPACEYSCVDFLVDFTISIDTLARTVTYTDITTGSPDKWSWNLGDGTQSSDANPFHTYTELGSYTICLTAENQEEACFQTICKDIELIDIDCQSEFDFTIDDLSLAFQSTSTSAQMINELIWTIDGDSLTNMESGTYTATESESIELCLSITSISDCVSTSCEIIELLNPCNVIPSFDAVTSFDTISLSNTSSGEYTNTTWTFGDGFTFSGNDVEYVYPQDGDYEICMTVQNSDAANCEFTICEMVSISSCEVNATFLVNIKQDTLKAALIAPLGDNSISWNFGNGFSANINPVQFVYPEVGDYTVCVTVTDTNLENCMETHCEEISIIITDIQTATLNDIDVYPNPIQIGKEVSIVNVERIDLKIELFTSNGQLVKTTIIDQGDRYLLSTNSLSSGKYLIHISTPEASVVKSLILVE